MSQDGVVIQESLAASWEEMSGFAVIEAGSLGLAGRIGTAQGLGSAMLT